MRRKTFIKWALFLALAVLSIFLIKSFTGNVVKDDGKEKIWLENNCECLERENIKCPEGFGLIKGKNLCYQTKIYCPSSSALDIKNCESKPVYSNVLLGCSKYQCGEGVYKVKLSKK